MHFFKKTEKPLSIKIKLMIHFGLFIKRKTPNPINEHEKTSPRLG